jgi:hypothetical protein
MGMPGPTAGRPPEEEDHHHTGEVKDMRNEVGKKQALTPPNPLIDEGFEGRSERMLWEQKVPGSNPGAPTSPVRTQVSAIAP